MTGLTLSQTFMCTISTTSVLRRQFAYLLKKNSFSKFKIKDGPLHFQAPILVLRWEGSTLRDCRVLELDFGGGEASAS